MLRLNLSGSRRFSFSCFKSASDLETNDCAAPGLSRLARAAPGRYNLRHCGRCTLKRLSRCLKTHRRNVEMNEAMLSVCPSLPRTATAPTILASLDPSPTAAAASDRKDQLFGCANGHFVRNQVCVFQTLGLLRICLICEDEWKSRYTSTV